jgi:glycosyltransferase involved in cell wall biosynthesis
MCDALTPALTASVQGETGLACMTVLPSFIGYDQGDSGSLDPLAGQPETILSAAKIAYTGTVHTESIDDFRLAIRAVGLVAARGYDVAFLYAGHALPRYDVMTIAEREGLPASRVASLGYVPFDQVRSILTKASVLVQPGRPNRFNQLRLPSKVQAYLQSGTPTVMFSVGLGELLRDGEEVVKLHGFNAEELAERIVELLEDPGFAVRVGEGGQRAAQRLFDRDRNVAALVHCYRVALETAAASPG